MSLTNPEEIKTFAVMSVLKSLGDRTYVLLDNYLMNVHGIFLGSQDSYSMEELRKALDAFIGEKSTRIILELAYVKMDELSVSKENPEFYENST